MDEDIGYDVQQWYHPECVEVPADVQSASAVAGYGRLKPADKKVCIRSEKFICVCIV